MGDRESLRQTGYLQMYEQRQEAMKDKANQQRDTAPIDADDAGAGTSTGSHSTSTVAQEGSASTSNSSNEAPSETPDATDQIMATLTQILAPHGLVTKLVDYDSITTLDNLVPMDPDIAAKFALENSVVTHFYKSSNSTKLQLCDQFPRPYFAGYNSIDMKKPYKAQDPLVCYVIGSRIENTTNG